MDDQVAAMGVFLREEVAAGRAYLPAGRDGLPRLPAAARRRPGADRRPGPVPDPGAPDRAVASPSTRTSGRCRRAWRTSTPSCAPTSASSRREHGDLTAWADQGVMLLNRIADRAARRAGVPPRPRVGADHRVRDRGAGARGGPCVAILWGADARKLKPLLGPIPCGGVRAPLAAVGVPGLLRLPPLQPGQRAAGRAGRGTGRLGPRTEGPSPRVCQPSPDRSVEM